MPVSPNFPTKLHILQHGSTPPTKRHSKWSHLCIILSWFFLHLKRFLFSAFVSSPFVCFFVSLDYKHTSGVGTLRVGRYWLKSHPHHDLHYLLLRISGPAFISYLMKNFTGMNHTWSFKTKSAQVLYLCGFWTKTMILDYFINLRLPKNTWM